MGSSSSIAEREKLQLLRPLQYCREREREKKLQLLRPLQYCRERERKTAITTTAPVLQIGRSCNYNDRSNIAERETAITTTAQVLQTERNCNYYDRSSIAERETATTSTAPELQKKRTCKYYDRSSIAERETALTTTAPVLQKEGNYNCCDPSSMASREKLQVLRPLQCCRDRETATITTAPNQKLEGRKLGRIQSWKMCCIPTVSAGILGVHLPTLRLPPYILCIHIYVRSIYTDIYITQQKLNPKTLLTGFTLAHDEFLDFTFQTL